MRWTVSLSHPWVSPEWRAIRSESAGISHRLVSVSAQLNKVWRAACVFPAGCITVNQPQEVSVCVCVCVWDFCHQHPEDTAVNSFSFTIMSQVCHDHMITIWITLYVKKPTLLWAPCQEGTKVGRHQESSCSAGLNLLLKCYQHLPPLSVNGLCMLKVVSCGPCARGDFPHLPKWPATLPSPRRPWSDLRG